MRAEPAVQRRARAAAQYQPGHIRCLLVAEAPPEDLRRYFYFDEVSTQDSLFREVAAVVLGEKPARSSKAAALADLRDRGIFLIDLSEEPKGSRRSLRDCVPDLVDRARALAPEKIVLIKVNVYDDAFRALRDVGLPVVDARIPFPGQGQQKKFRLAFAAALRASPG